MTAKKLSQLPEANPALPMEIFGLQRGKPVVITRDELADAIATTEPAAVASAAAALVSKNNAATAATNADGHEADALASKDLAATYVAPSTTSKNNAATHEAGALAAKNAAEASATTTSSIADDARISSAGAQSQLNVVLTSVADSYADRLSAEEAVNSAKINARRASSVLNQDLSGMVTAMHRSPNAIVATLVMEPWKDSDGGAWRKRVQASYMTEALNGTWLGWHASEMDARDYFGSLGVASIVTGDSSNFANGVGAWATNAGGNCTIAAVNGRLRMTATGASPITYLAFPTVVGQRYRISLNRVTPVGGGKVGTLTIATVAGGSSLGNQSLGVNTPGPLSVSFVASATTTYINYLGSASWVAGDFMEMDDFTVKPVDLSKNPSGAYYGDTTDGKFKRLWRNLAGASEFPNGVGDAQNRGGPISATTMTGYAGAIAFGRDGVNPAYAYKPILGQVLGVTYMVSAVVQMDDNGAPTFGVGAHDGAGNDFVLVVAGNPIPTANYGVAALSNNQYRVSVTFTSTLTNSNFGVVKYPANSTRTFKATAYHFEVVAPGTGFSSYEQRTTSGNGVDETFRGNTPEFPSLPVAVAEASRVVIYDAAAVGRPMWMVFAGVSAATLVRGTNLTGVAMREGLLLLAHGNSSGLAVVDFAKDDSYLISSSGLWRRPGKQRITDRNDASVAWVLQSSAPAIANPTINAVAATTLPDAPVDPVTGLQVPTIAVMTAGGTSVIRHDGSVVSATGATMTGISIAFNQRGDVVLSRGADSKLVVWRKRRWSTGDLQFNTVLNVASRQISGKAVAAGRVTALGGGAAPLGLAVDSEMDTTVDQGTSSPRAYIDAAYNTGYMAGDIRRALLADVGAGVVSDMELLTNPNFDTDTSGWALNRATGTVTAGVVRLTGTGQYVSLSQTINTVPGQTYKVVCDYKGNPYARNVLLYAGTAAGSGNLGNTQMGATAGVFELTFTATTTTTYIFTQDSGTLAVGEWYEVSSVSAKIAVADRSYKAKPSNIVGSLVKTAVAAAAQMVFWSGFSNDPAFGTELVVDGKFDANAAGWSPVNGATVAWDAAAGGRLSVTPLAGNSYGAASANLSANMVPGRTYALTFDVTSAANISVQVNGQTVAPSALRNGTGFSFVFQATSTQRSVSLVVNTSAGTTAYFDNVSVKQYDAIGSAANVVQEAYSADLDPGTGALAVGVWGSLPVTFGDVLSKGPEMRQNAVTRLNGDAAAATYDPITGDGSATRVDTTNQSYVLLSGLPTSGYCWVTLTNTSANAVTVRSPSPSSTIHLNVPAGQTMSGRVPLTAGQISISSGVNGTSASWTGLSIKEELPVWAVDRSAPTGAYYRVGVNAGGFLVAELSDGATIRTVTSTVAYNTAQAFSAFATYDTSGTLTLWVNGERAGQTTGTPLASLSNAAALLTIGNSRTLNAAWPGSLALVKIGMTAPSEDAIRWMYSQERAMFQPGAQVTLPDAGAVVDMDYDDATGRLCGASAANEWCFQGLVRTYSAPVAAGSHTKVSSRSGVKLLARSGTNPGVDISTQSKNLLEELYRKGEEARRLGQPTSPLDWVGGFTANMSNGSVFLSSITGVSPAPSGSTYSGAAFSGAGVAAGATVPGSIGATAFMDKPATASGTGVSIAFQDFILPTGMTAVRVTVDGVAKREGETKDWVRLFNGFRETIRFNTAPGATTWVRILVAKTNT